MNAHLNNEFKNYKQSDFLSDTFDLINQINKRFKDLHMRFIRKFKISLAQYCVIRHLGKYRECKLKELASKCSLSRPTMTGVIDTMEKHNLVKREINKKDRRSFLTKLTEKGENIYKSLPKQNTIFKNCCAGLNPKEIQELNRLLVKILLNFE